MAQAADHHTHVIHYTVNDEPQQTDRHELTPVQIMQGAGVNPAENYLVQIFGRERKSYQSDPNTPVRIEVHAKFITIFTGPVPVS